MIVGTFANIKAKSFIRGLYNWVYCISRSIFRTSEVILRRFGVRLPRYEQNCLNAGFKLGFATFAVLFLKHWRKF